MNEVKLKKMNKAELLRLFEETGGKIEIINSFFSDIEKIKQPLIETSEKISGEKGIAATIEKQFKEINEVYNEMCIDDEKGNSVKTQMEGFLVDLEAEDKKAKEMEIFYQKQEEKYKALYKQIEEELKAGATSVNLSKSFADKVGEYKKDTQMWSLLFVVLVTGLVAFYGITTFYFDEIKTVQDVWKNLAFRAPFLIFAVWLAMFLGNRRAESKKLEELYKHKEVLARSFVGYKQTLDALNEDDESLLKKHMDNLLGAINENSASFLNSEGDKHPIFELLTSFFNRHKKDKEE